MAVTMQELQETLMRALAAAMDRGTELESRVKLLEARVAALEQMWITQLRSCLPGDPKGGE